MQRVGSYLAEDSCFIKHQFQNDRTVAARVNTYDVEDTGINSLGCPLAKKPVIETQRPPLLNDKAPIEETRAPDLENSTLTNHDDDKDFPEGGFKGWSVVIGSFCGSFSVFGIINSTAILLEYFSTHQLKDYSPSQIGWIFGLSLFLTFFCGAPIGPVFDSYGPRALIFAGSILLVASMFLLGLCTRKYLKSSFAKGQSS